jgi:hypothetical protein
VDEEADTGLIRLEASTVVVIVDSVVPHRVGTLLTQPIADINVDCTQFESDELLDLPLSKHIGNVSNNVVPLECSRSGRLPVEPEQQQPRLSEPRWREREQISRGQERPVKSSEQVSSSKVSFVSKWDVFRACHPMHGSMAFYYVRSMDPYQFVWLQN